MNRRKSLFIIDDDRTMIDLLRLTFTYSDYDIHEAMCAEEALRQIKVVIPNTILLDVMLPGEMNGFQLCKTIKSDPELKHIRIILLSARGQKTDLELGGENGADAYIVKPFSPSRLLETIKNSMRCES
jgi:DNA-binding response OmpR family regulator